MKRGRGKSTFRSNKRSKATKRAPKRKYSRVDTYQNKRLRRIESMIETKECQRRTNVDVSLYHNNVNAVLDSTGANLNPFLCNTGANDPMGRNDGNRIGDRISVKGLLIRAFFENALGRAKVYYRVMLLRVPKGDLVDRTTVFKNDADNKMIDQVNTERFTIIAQKIFNISASNLAPASVIPNINGVPSGGTPAGIATKTFKMWIPGRKFGRNGTIQYENATNQVKFFDYRLVIVVYDWYGTPQDINAVGKINELYTKVYFKDA